MPTPIELQVSDASAESSLTSGAQYVWRVGYYVDGEVVYTGWGDEFTSISPMTATIQSGQNIDIGTGKILYSNVYDTLADLPAASDYHGMFAHVHAEGAAYYAHAGNWVKLANNSSVPSSYISTLNGLSGAVTIGAGSGVTVTQAGSTLLISAAGAVTSVNAESGALTLVGGDNIGIATQDGIITISGQPSGVTWSTAPLMPTDAGSEGDIAYNDNYFFVRTSQGWRRTALSEWDAEIVISSQPQNLSLQPGGSGNFTVTAIASDGSTVGYQWQNSDDNGVTWDTITGSTAATYGVSGVSLTDNGTLYRVVLSAANITSVTSDSATLLVAESYDLLTEGGDTITSEAGDQVNQENFDGLTILQQPSSQEIVATSPSTAVTFSATAANGSGGSVSYQWQELPYGGSWANLSGETSSNLTLTAYQGTSRRQYRVVATSGGSQETSNAALLTVHTQVGDNYMVDFGYPNPWPMQISYSSNLAQVAGVDGYTIASSTDPNSNPTYASDVKLVSMTVYKDGSSVASSYNSTGVGSFYYDGSSYYILEVAPGSQSYQNATPLPSGEYRVQGTLSYNTGSGSSEYGGSQVSTHNFTV